MYKVNNQNLEKIAKFFVGDSPKLLTYKSGPKIMDFFNNNFGFEEEYVAPIPTRYIIALNNLIKLQDENRLMEFFNVLVSPEYYASQSEIVMKKNEIQEKAHEILEMLNGILLSQNLELQYNHQKRTYILTNLNEGLEYITSGGFADIYRETSDYSKKYIVKRIKDDYFNDSALRSRFKREFLITQSLNDVNHIIKVIDFDEKTCSYRMNYESSTLYHLIKSKKSISISNRVKIIEQIINTMIIVHSRDICHRDLSPTNIFVDDNFDIKIADFGLGKDAKIINSHKTLSTNAYGNSDYCSPEQLEHLKDGNALSDIYAIGKIINFIMTGRPTNYNHEFSPITVTATMENPDERFENLKELEKSLNSIIVRQDEKELEKRAINKIRSEIDDMDTKLYLSIIRLNTSKLAHNLVEVPNFGSYLAKYMNLNKNYAQEIMDEIWEELESKSWSWKGYDKFAFFGKDILIKTKLPNLVKEDAARIIHFVAHDKNRYGIQELEKKLKESHILEPNIEDLL